MPISKLTQSRTSFSQSRSLQMETGSSQVPKTEEFNSGIHAPVTPNSCSKATRTASSPSPHPHLEDPSLQVPVTCVPGFGVINLSKADVCKAAHFLFPEKKNRDTSMASLMIGYMNGWNGWNGMEGLKGYLSNVCENFLVSGVWWI